MATLGRNGSVAVSSSVLVPGTTGDGADAVDTAIAADMAIARATVIAGAMRGVQVMAALVALVPGRAMDSQDQRMAVVSVAVATPAVGLAAAVT